jgi:hypothetical protein
MGLIDKARYVYDELARNYDDSWWWRKRIAARIHKPIHARYPGYDDAMHVMDEDWDTLIVLDACRADLFEEVVGRERFDRYQRVTSLGSATAEWTKRNFADGEFGDTVYIASNPHTSKFAGDSFHELVEVWKEAFDEEKRTVLPEAITEAALDAHERHPDKRLVVHYMQPHRPFVEAKDLQFEGWHPKWHYERKEMDGIRHPFHALEAGLTDRETVWNAYADNLSLVIDDALSVAEAVDGRTVLTSDHGNMLGERTFPIPVRMYAHPRGVRSPELVRVPWAVLDGERRDVVDEGTTAAEPGDSEEMTDRLEALGYV